MRKFSRAFFAIVLFAVLFGQIDASAQKSRATIRVDPVNKQEQVDDKSFRHAKDTNANNANQNEKIDNAQSFNSYYISDIIKNKNLEVRYENYEDYRQFSNFLQLSSLPKRAFFSMLHPVADAVALAAIENGNAIQLSRQIPTYPDLREAIKNNAHSVLVVFGHIESNGTNGPQFVMRDSQNKIAFSISLAAILRDATDNSVEIVFVGCNTFNFGSAAGIKGNIQANDLNDVIKGIMNAKNRKDMYLSLSIKGIKSILDVRKFKDSNKWYFEINRNDNIAEDESHSDDGGGVATRYIAIVVNPNFEYENAPRPTEFNEVSRWEKLLNYEKKSFKNFLEFIYAIAFLSLSFLIKSKIPEDFIYKFSSKFPILVVLFSLPGYLCWIIVFKWLAILAFCVIFGGLSIIFFNHQLPW